MEPCFPGNPQEAIIKGFAKAEKAFMEKVYDPVKNQLRDKSGSCAIVVLIVQETCYVANVGDSRAALSSEGGKKVYPLSFDHKPGDDKEAARIKEAGGEIYYRTATNQIVQYNKDRVDKYQQLNLAGPLRVLPGRLSVARTFGDPEAKIPALGGNPKVVIHSPEIKSFQIKRDHDFIVLGCDGIFDKMSNSDSVSCVWKAAHDNKHHPSVKGQVKDVHKMCGMGVEYILKNSLLRRSLDNVTVVIIGFSNFKHQVFGHQAQGRSARGESAEEQVAAGEPEQKPAFVDHQTKIIERTRSANLPKYQPESRQQRPVPAAQLQSKTRSTLSTSSGGNHNDENDPNVTNGSQLKTKEQHSSRSFHQGKPADMKPPIQARLQTHKSFVAATGPSQADRPPSSVAKDPRQMKPSSLLGQHISKYMKVPLSTKNVVSSHRDKPSFSFPSNDI